MKPKQNKKWTNAGASGSSFRKSRETKPEKAQLVKCKASSGLRRSVRPARRTQTAEASMSQQMRTDAGMERAANSPNTIRVDEHQLPDFTVFTVYRHHRCYKRLTPTKGDGAAQWFKQDASGNRSLVSERRAKRLDRIWKRRDSYPRVRRYPRRDAKGERLLSDLAAAHANGQLDVAVALLDQIKKHLGSSIALVDGDSIWGTLPRFDPTLVQETKWLIPSFLAEGSIQLVYGERGSFKSTLMLGAAKAVANREEFLGLKTRRRRVLVLDFENPPNIISARNEDLGLDLSRNPNLIVWDRFRTEPIPRPDDPLLVDLVRDCVTETGYGPWIIFDSWASLLKHGEGGELTGQIAPIYQRFRRLADLGATITILDHSRKYDKSTIYGGQDKEAKADSIHNLSVFPNKAKPNNPIIRVESWLKRYAPQGEGSFAFEVQSEQDRKGNWHIVDLVPAQDPEKAKALENIHLLQNLIRQNPNSGQEDLARLAAKQEIISRDQAITILKEGIGKYWQRRRISHNKFSYSLI